MNGIPVLKSKLIMPELSGNFLLTDRLKRLHQDMDSCRAVTICAPAGYGKTTLAVSYFNHQAARPFRVCWYRADPEDKNLSVFISHLSEAIFPSESGDFAESRKAIDEQIGMQLHSQQAISVICHEMWTRYGQSRDISTYIVLDDFQNVAQVGEICDMMKYMLDNLPPSCALFLLNRSNMNVFTVKQKLEQKILEICAEDLAFNNAEVEKLMVRMGQSVPDRELAAIIEKSMEGWIAGIIILFQAAKSVGSQNTSIETGKLGHEDALFRYLSMEVLRSVDMKTQDDLARLAVLCDFSEAEASEIFGIFDIKSLIGQCLGFGMFIQTIPGNPVVYRFHSLFREFLLYILNSRYPVEHIAGLHLKAAGYYIDHMTYGRAAEHLAKCGNSASAMEMVTKAGFNKFLIGETAQLKIWLDLLPEEMIRGNPILLMYKAQLMPNSRQLEMITPLNRILQTSLQDNRPDTYYNAASVLIYIYMCSNNMKGLREMAASSSWKLQEAPEQLKNTLGILDMVKSMGEERFLLAEAQNDNIVYALLPEDSQWLYLILSCINYNCIGKLDHAERCMRTALILEHFKKIEPARGFILLFLTTTLALKNEKQSMLPYISEIIAIGEKYDYEYLVANGRRLSAFERYLSLDTDTAAEMLDYAVFQYLQMNNKAMAEACRLLRLLWTWTIRRYSSSQEMEEARKCIATIRKARPGMMVYETSLSILGAIARESGDFDFAERCLLSSIKAAKAKKGLQVLCGSLFHTAKLYFAKGDSEQEHCYLKQAVELAAGNRYFMFWDIHIPTLVEMSLRSIRYGYCTGYIEELLSKFFSSKAVKYLCEKAKAIDESRITAFVDDFVTTYNAEKTEQLYFVTASLFGKPRIAINGVMIPDPEWKTKKVKGFLEYLLLNSGNTVSKEILAEIFWPDADSKSSIASQRTALYYLRKILSKYHAEITGENAFIYETLEGLQIKKNAALGLDIHEFLHLYNEVLRMSKESTASEQKMADLLEKMISIYNGELMEGSDYGDLVFHERERFRSIFMEACQKLSEIYLKLGDLHKAEEILRRALAVEPYSENVCLELLKLYMSEGRRSKAVRLYYSFKNRLEQDLDIKVDVRLTEAIRSPGHEK